VTSAHPAEPGRRPRRLAASPWLHVLCLAALSAAFESLFLRHGLNALDEGWPLYAAKQLHEGGVLYRDVFFVFPPAHALGAWLAYAWSPPGVVLARLFYSAFNVALCVAIYLLARRLMPPAGALLAGALVALAAPDSHGAHYLFGYRYMVFSVAALWCFSERLRTGERRWLVVAGALAGVGLLFRLDPALTAIGGIGAGLLVSGRGARSRWAEGARFALGFAAVVVPVLAWLAAGVGWEALWREAVVRPIAMTDLQSLPVPKLLIPLSGDRWLVRRSFVTVQFRLFALLYALLAAVLLTRLARALAAGRRFEAPLLLAVVTWGGLYFVRSFGRSDEAHLDSAVPAALLVTAYAIGAPLRGALGRPGWRRRAAQLALAAALAVWAYLTAVDRYLDPAVRGTLPVQALGGAVEIRPNHRWRHFDRLVEEIRARTEPGDVVLDLTASSLLHVASGRKGPGYADVLMPGTFLDEQEEGAFVARLQRSPPALVIAPTTPFDRMPERALERWAPQVARWVRIRYEVRAQVGPYRLMAPR